MTALECWRKIMYCSKCGTRLQDDAKFCSQCGSRLEDLFQKEDKSDSESSKSQCITKGGSVEQRRSWLISTPVYVISWIALIGTISAIVLGPRSPQIGLALSFWCGVTAAISGRRRTKSGLLWFFIGLIPIGFSLYFILVFLKTIFLRH